MKRLPIIFTVAAVVALSASLAYWGLQLFKPQQRAIAAAPLAAALPPNMDAAKGLFGGQVTAAAVSNYQLKGVVAAPGSDNADSAAILSVDNKPALALAVGREVAPGVTVKEVHPKYVLLSEGGVIKRVDLASDAGISSVPGAAAPPSNLLSQPLPPIQPQQPAAQPPVGVPSPAPPPPMPQNPPPKTNGSPTGMPVPGFERQ